MASLTIRKLDDAVKAYLRLRAARNGRSVEEEVRVILGEHIQGTRAPAAATLARCRRPGTRPRSPTAPPARSASP